MPSPQFLSLIFQKSPGTFDPSLGDSFTGWKHDDDVLAGKATQEDGFVLEITVFGDAMSLL